MTGRLAAVRPAMTSASARLELAADHVSRSQPAQHLFIDGRVKPVTADARPGIQRPRRLHLRDCRARGCMHGKVESDPVGRPDRFERRRLAGKVGCGNFVAISPQPCGRRGQPERLPSEIVCGD